MPLPGRLSAPHALDDVLLYRLSRLAAAAGSMVVRLCEGRFGITRREWRILGLLAQHDGLLSSQLADRARLDRARTSKAITSLVAKQLLQRQPLAGDRRLVMLSITEAGRAVYDGLYPMVLAINRDLLASLGEGQVAQLDQTLDTLQQRAEQLLAQAELPKADRRRGAAPRRPRG